MADTNPGLGIPPTASPKDVWIVGRQIRRLPGSGEFTLQRGPVDGAFGYMEHFSFKGETGFQISASQKLDEGPDGIVDYNHATTTYRIEAPMESDGRTPTSHRTIVTFQTHQSIDSVGGLAAASIFTSVLSNNLLPY